MVYIYMNDEKAVHVSQDSSFGSAIPLYGKYTHITESTAAAAALLM
jgi:hypothetical protein